MVRKGKEVVPGSWEDMQIAAAEQRDRLNKGRAEAFASGPKTPVICFDEPTGDGCFVGVVVDAKTGEELWRGRPLESSEDANYAARETAITCGLSQVDGLIPGGYRRPQR